MDHDNENDGQVRELRVEGLSLFILAALFLAAMAGAFYVGRWVERRSAPDHSLTAAGPGLGDEHAGSEGAEDAEGVEVTYFDTVAGGEKAAEPGRQLPAEKAAEPTRLAETPTAKEPPSETSAPKPTAPSEPASGPPGTVGPAEGPHYVQVIAVTNRESAMSVVDTLKAKGYRVRLDTQRQRDGALYKVRVGGYPTEKEARAAAERLRAGGYPGAWVTRVD